MALRWFNSIPTFARAVIIILAAMMLFDIMGAIIKHLGDRYPVQQLSVLRNAFGMVPSVLVLFMSRDWHRAGRPIIIRNWRMALFRGALVAFAQFCYYSGLVYMEFATVNTLTFVSPMFVTALSLPILGIRVSIWRWLAVGIGFVGVILIMQPGTSVFTFYALLPLGAAFGYAASSVTVRLIDTEVPSATINIYSTFGALICSIILMVLTSGFEPVASTQDWLWIFAMGAVGGCAVILLIMAYRLTQPSNLAPFEYFGIPFSFAIGWYIFSEAPFDTLFPGALFIIGGGLLIVWRERRKKKTKTE